MSFKVLNAVMMIVSTSVGMGILGLPIVTAGSGFIPTLGSFAIAWIFMTIAAFYILEIKMQVRGHYSLASMIKLTLGKSGHIFATIIILLLLYALLSTYLMAAVAWIKLLLPALTHYTELSIALVFTLIFVLVMMCREQRLYAVNNILGIGVLFTFLLITCCSIIPRHPAFLTHIHLKAILPALPLLLTTFGFSIVVPAITEYLHYDKAKTKKAIFLGSFISLIAYGIWEWVALGNIPLEGSLSFSSLKQMGDNGTGVIVALATFSQHPWVILFGKMFALLLVITSFLGISLALIHFLSDLLHFPIQDNRRLLLSALMYIPPVIIIAFYPRAFVQFLSFAGIFVAILLGLFPALMIASIKKNHSLIHRIGVSAVSLFFLLVIVQEIINLSE